MRKSSVAILFAASVTLASMWPAFTARAQIPTERLNLEDVQRIIAQAATRAQKLAPTSVIAVVDREGFVLGVWSVEGNANLSVDPNFNNAAPGPSAGTQRIGVAVREAGTASYLSSDNNAFTSRTAQFIIQQNFPPGILNQPAGPLVGVAFSNFPYSDVNRFRRLDPGPNGEVPGTPGCGFIVDATGKVVSFGTGIPGTRLSGRSSSCPLYKNDVLVGGIGVFSGADDALKNIVNVELRNEVAGYMTDEFVALAGQVGFSPKSAIFASNATINGIRVPYVLGRAKAVSAKPLAELGAAVAGYSLRASPPPFPFPQEFLGGQNVEVRFPIKADPTAGDIRGQARLTADEVRGCVARASDRARTTRAGIRLPVGGAMQVWITVVGNPNQDGVPAPILAITRTPGATFFSFDVALQKARTALFFSSDQRAFSSRTVGFLAQNFYPPGLEGRAPGPFGPEVPKIKKDGSPKLATLGLQVKFSLPLIPLSTPVPGVKAAVPPDPNLPNGITVFPGGFPLYRNGVLIGAVGISGDGVDQDDIAGASGVGAQFAPPDAIRADQLTYDGARLPFAKFPRNPER